MKNNGMKIDYMGGHLYISDSIDFDLEQLKGIKCPLSDSEILMKLTYYKNGMLKKETPDGICTISGPLDEFKEI